MKAAFPPQLPQPHREARRPAGAHGFPVAPSAPVHAAPDQGGGRDRIAAQDRDHRAHRAGRRPARPLRDRALPMHEKVRAEIAQKGLAQSHIVFLEALLKLRQVCCDPRASQAGGGAQGEGLGQAGAADGDGARTRRRGTEDPRLLAVHLHAGADPEDLEARAFATAAHRRHPGPQASVRLFQSGISACS